MTGKQWSVAAVVVVAAAVIAFVAMRGPGVGNNGTEGTIGAANRYQSEQIGNQDVSLDNPAIATFIQSDAFRKLVANAEFQRLVKDEAFTSLLGAEGLRRQIEAGRLASLLADDNLRLLLDNASFRMAAGRGSFTEAFKMADLARLMDAGFVRTIEARGFRDMALTADFQRFVEAARQLEPARMNAEGLRELAARYESLMKMDAFQAFLNADNLRSLTDAGFFGVFMDAARTQLVMDQAFMDALKLDAFRGAMKMDGFTGVLEALNTPAMLDAAKVLSASPDALQAFRMDELRNVVMDPAFGSLVSADMLKEAAARVMSE